MPEIIGVAVGQREALKSCAVLRRSRAEPDTAAICQRTSEGGKSMLHVLGSILAGIGSVLLILLLVLAVLILCLLFTPFFTEAG